MIFDILELKTLSDPLMYIRNILEPLYSYTAPTYIRAIKKYDAEII